MQPGYQDRRGEAPRPPAKKKPAPQKRRRRNSDRQINPADKTRRRAAPHTNAPRRRRRRRRSNLHYPVLITLVAAAGIALALTFLFRIETIRVIGSDRYSPSDIIEASGIIAGDNLLRLNSQEIEEAILGQFPYIESVRVRRRFPPAVQLVVTQSTPAYAVRTVRGIALITEEGKLLEVGETLIPPPDLPVITGLVTDGFSPGQRIDFDPENAERLVMLRYLYEAAENTAFGKITNVDVSNRLNMTLVYEDRLLLVLGSEADLEYKLTFLREVINDLKPDDQARLDASNSADRRILVKWGKLEDGRFIPYTIVGYDEIFGEAYDGDE